MLRQQIDAILDAENEAKRRLNEAHEQARSLAATARATRAPLLDQARETARRAARETVERGRVETEHDRDKLLAETRRRIEEDRQESVSDTFVNRAVETIAGLQP